MYFDSILIDPGHGYFEKDKYGSGFSAGHLMEVTLVDQYILGICDELDYEGIRWHVLETRKSPGLSEAKRAERCLPGMLVLSCHIGQNDKESPIATSRAYYGHSQSKDLAGRLAQTMADWGKGISWVHANGGALQKETPILRGPNVSIELEPFAVNDLAGLDYAAKLDQLGRAIGKTVATYAKSVSPGLGPHPLRCREKPWLTQAAK